MRKSVGRRKDTRVIIFGAHSPDWMNALGPGAPVWSLLPEVVEVLLLPGEAEAVIPLPKAGVSRTVLIPLMENHTRVCPKSAGATLFPDRRSLEVLGDKRLFSEYVEARRLTRFCPKTYREGDAIRFPCVLKRTDLNAGSGVAVVESPEHLRAMLEQDPWKGHDWILQEKVGSGLEYVTHAVCDRGRIRWSCTFAYEMQSGEDIRTPVNVRSTQPVELEPRILRGLQALLKPLRYTGPMNVDYKVSDQGRLLVFEINPRLGGSLMKPQFVGHLQGALSCIIENAFDAKKPPFLWVFKREWGPALGLLQRWVERMQKSRQSIYSG